MKKTTEIAALLAVTILLSGCATPYMADRWRDAADIFTITAGVGGGAKARVGPLQAGLLYQSDSVGIRNGSFFAQKPSLSFEDIGDGGWDFNLLICGAEWSNAGDVIRERHKEFNTFNVIVPVAVVEPMSRQLKPHYFFQIEGVIGLGGTIRLGFNPAELVDFLLGWTTVDIFGDDIERKRSLQEMHRTE